MHKAGAIALLPWNDMKGSKIYDGSNLEMAKSVLVFLLDQ
jgi:hypothetical protein